ncbi:MAG: hypothetical protein GY811_15730 [Myxococcales bacterium]|nr:hypothetical protein [Myxococcales bacterium]
MSTLVRQSPRFLRSCLMATALTALACGSTVEGVSDDAGIDANGGSDASAFGGVGDSCDAESPCASNLLCAGGECVDPEGECTSDSDCNGDTYCCIDDCLPEGVTKGACIDYGTGPRDNVNDECVGEVVIGLFQADTQCEWAGPPAGDPFPNHIQVLTTPMVADLPHDSGAASEITIVTYNNNDGSIQAGYGADPNFYGVIRILNGQTCEQLESIHDPDNKIVAASPPAIADLDGDGTGEIVTQRALTGLVAFKWNAALSQSELFWAATDSNLADTLRWDGPALHDLNDDGLPEVISGGEVYNGTTGARLNSGQVIGGAMELSVVGDVDNNLVPNLVSEDVYSWNTTNNTWDLAYPGAPNTGATHFAYADFGTPGATPAEFDPTLLDGIAEIVATGGNRASLSTLQGQVIFDVTGFSGGGPPTVGDFDDDGFPEFASAGGAAYRVFDLDCPVGDEANCIAPYVRWSQPSQDQSSRRTGSAIFDFEGDGKAEAVYADECFTRIYDGTTGDVLYSAFRTSCTWYENAVIADPDKDSNTEILIGSNANCAITCPEIDPIHPGIPCEGVSDCLSGVCDAGFCRCTDDAECDDGYQCETPIVGTQGTGDTCRAVHPPGVGLTGLRVLRDRLDRWSSSRPVWNQHTYAVTNINDDLSVPQTSQWLQNYLQAGLNNFRQNIQGDTAARDLPDITGSIDEESACQIDGATTSLVATVCNRGNRPVGAALPATFYEGTIAPENVLCTSYTAGPVPVGDCLEVSCEIDSTVTGDIIMVVNDDGNGGQITVECIGDNNDDSANITGCTVVD